MKGINPDINVVISSRYNLDSDEEKLLALSCDGFVNKSYSMMQLRQKIEKTLNG